MYDSVGLQEILQTSQNLRTESLESFKDDLLHRLSSWNFFPNLSYKNPAFFAAFSGSLIKNRLADYSPSSLSTDRSDKEDSTDAGPDGPLSSLEPGLPSNAVLRHHAVHTEVNTRINLQDFMRAAAEKAAAMRESSTSTSSSSETDEDDSLTNEEFDDQESDDEELPDFDVCPIMPELPGESGSIRKVREIERQNVQRRVSGKI